MDKISSTDFFNMHAFDHAPAALRILRFATDNVQRVLELAHTSTFLRECAIEFDGANATLPKALRNEYVANRYFKLRDIVEHNQAQCQWLAQKILRCRSAAPIPTEALATDVTRHDITCDARYHPNIVVSPTTLALTIEGDTGAYAWVQGKIGVTNGKHYFSVTVTRNRFGWVKVGWVDRLQTNNHDEYGPGNDNSCTSGAVFQLCGNFSFGTAPLATDQRDLVSTVKCPCTVGCLLDTDADTMTVFVDGKPRDEQCKYKFPKNDYVWFPSVGLSQSGSELYFNAV
jgi:hypothetical protein